MRRAFSSGNQAMCDTEFLRLATLFNERLVPSTTKNSPSRRFGKFNSLVNRQDSDSARQGSVFGFMRMTREVLGFSEVELSESQACRLWMTGFKLPPSKPLDTGASVTTGKPAQSVKLVTLREIADFSAWRNEAKAMQASSCAARTCRL